MEWAVRLVSAFVSVALILSLSLTVSLPARADDHTVACERLQELSSLIVSNHYVPDEVLGYAKRHCRTGTRVDDKVEYSRYSPTPWLSSSEPCRAVKRSPKALHEAECVVSWLAFWRQNGNVSDECRQRMNAKIEEGGLKTNLAQLRDLCPQEDQTGFPVSLTVAGIVIGVIMLIGFIIRLFGGGGNGGGGDGFNREQYMAALALRVDRMQQIGRDIQRGNK